jgi:putative endopeptidase
MNTDAIEASGVAPIRPWLDLIEGIETIEDLRTAFTELNMIGAGVGWDSYVEPDRANTTENLLYVRQGGLGLPDRDYYFRDDETSLSVAAAYRAHITTMLSLLGRDEADAASASDTIWAIESRMAKASNTAVQQRDVQDTTNKLTRGELDSLTPTIDLSDWLDVIGAGNESAVNVDNLRFFKELDIMFNDVSIEDWRTYCEWHLLNSTANSLPKRFDDASFAFWGVIVGGQKEQKPRWKRVIAAAGSSIGHLVSQLYVKDNFPPESKERVEGLVDRLLVEMGRSIDSINWMGDETKVHAREKLAGFGYKIGYPDVWRDYSDLSISADHWLENKLNARRFEFNRTISTLGKPLDPHEWLMPPHVVNAYYWPERNEIVFPAGILQPPFFDAGADDAVNLGGIGVVIGHEITHGFDDKGSLYDATGHLRNWWTEKDRTEFDKRAEMISNQFDGYEIEEGLTVNGALTLGENIADLAGLTLAFGALKAIQAESGATTVAGLSPEQRFFLAYARVWRTNSTPEYLRLIVNSDPHSPAKFRVLGPLSNLPEFAEAFAIPQDAPVMRPEDERAKVW